MSTEFKKVLLKKNNLKKKKKNHATELSISIIIFLDY